MKKMIHLLKKQLRESNGRKCHGALFLLSSVDSIQADAVVYINVIVNINTTGSVKIAEGNNHPDLLCNVNFPKLRLLFSKFVLIHGVIQLRLSSIKYPHCKYLEFHWNSLIL